MNDFDWLRLEKDKRNSVKSVNLLTRNQIYMQVKLMKMKKQMIYKMFEASMYRNNNNNDNSNNNKLIKF